MVTVVYLGDHYVVDIVIGAAYALAGWLLVPRLFERGPLRRLAGPFPSPLGGDDGRSDPLRSGP